jgi:hypothetical protein
MEGVFDTDGDGIIDADEATIILKNALQVCEEREREREKTGREDRSVPRLWSFTYSQR